MPSSEAKFQHQECTSVTGDDDGPQPMRDCKPSKTTPNSADQFREAHQAAYEARGRRSTDDVERVKDHNANYPALRDELDKRRSTARVKAVQTRRAVPTDSILCSACLKLRRRKMRKNIRSRRQRRRNRRYRSNDRAHRSSRPVREVYRNKRAVNKRGSRARGVASPREGSVSLNINKSRSDVGSLKNPSTPEHSVSSYHSYPSLDHEPMVS